MMTYCQLDPQKNISMNFEICISMITIQHFLFENMKKKMLSA